MSLRNDLLDSRTLIRSRDRRVIDGNRGPKRTVVIHPFGIAGYQTDTARGFSNTHIVVGCRVQSHIVRAAVKDGVNQKSFPDTGCVLGVDSMVHVSPAVFGRGLEGPKGSVRTCGGQKGLERDDKSVVAVLHKDGHAVHLLVNADEIRPVGPDNWFQVGKHLS